KHATEPGEVADVAGLVEPKLLAQVGERLWRGRLAKDRLGDVARQDIRAHEDQHGDGWQKDDAEREALDDQLQDRRGHWLPDGGSEVASMCENEAEGAGRSGRPLHRD